MDVGFTIFRVCDNSRLKPVSREKLGNARYCSVLPERAFLSESVLKNVHV